MNELAILQKQATSLINKCETKGYHFSDIEIAVISNISKAKTLNEVNWLALQFFEGLCDRHK